MRTMWGRRLFLWVCALSARANIIGPRFLYWHGGRYMTASATTNTPHNAVLLFHATTSQRRACACTSPVRTSRDTIPELLLGSSPPGPRSLSTTITTGASLFSRPPLPPFSRAPRSLPRCLSFTSPLRRLSGAPFPAVFFRQLLA